MSQGLRQSTSNVQKQVQSQKQALLYSQIVFLNRVALSLEKIEEFVKCQVLENPALEIADDGMDPSPRHPKNPGVQPGILRTSLVDYHCRQLGDDASFRTGRNPRHEDADCAPSIEEYVPDRESLYRSLLRQLAMTPMNESDRRIGEHIVGAINDSGYLSEPLSNVIEDLGCTLRQAEAVLRVVQTFEPAGVGARTAGECLKLILLDLDFREPSVLRAAESLPKALLRMTAGELARMHGLSAERAGKLAAVLRRVDLRPGASVCPARPTHIRPDLVLHIVDGEPLVEVNDGCLTSVRLNGMVRDLVRRGSQLDVEAKKVLRRQLREARSLLTQLDNRKNLLLSVTTAIVEHQPGFVDNGMDGLLPLKMKVIADQLEVHESTISRAVKGKYISTPFGTYELRAFFCNGLGDNNLGPVASSVIKKDIASIIAAENRSDPYTDLEIAVQIRKLRPGVDIARRTVAKYRTSMGYPGVRARTRAA